MQELLDRDLVERAQAGDDGAFAELVSRHDARLRAVGRRLLRRPDRVEDALQEAYLRAFRNIGRLQNDSSVSAWLYRITFNACLDEIRRHRKVVLLPPDADSPSPETGPAEQAVARIEATEVLDGLAPEVRSTVVLVHGYGFDYAGASRALGIPPGTVASRLNRVRGRVRSAATQQEVTSDAA